MLGLPDKEAAPLPNNVRGLVLVADSDHLVREAIGRALSQAGIQALTVPSKRQALDAIQLNRARLRVVVATSRMNLAREAPLASLPLVLLCRSGDVDQTRPMELRIRLQQIPLPTEEIVRTVREILGRQISAAAQVSDLVGASPAMIDLRAEIAQCAAVDCPVLISGPTGTGKELVAQALHQLSPTRKNGAFVAVHVGALPAELLESELFGHERGAFTHASYTRVGLAETAAHGTLFLDEISTMPWHMQAKLLRFCQSREARRVGGNDSRILDTRIVAATNVDLWDLVNRGQFRSDLYYRLCVAEIAVPSLAQRAGDVAVLVDHFLTKYAAHYKRKRPTVAAAALKALEKWKFPGNVRELENLIHRAVLFAGETIELADLEKRRAKPARGGGPTDCATCQYRPGH